MKSGNDGDALDSRSSSCTPALAFPRCSHAPACKRVANSTRFQCNLAQHAGRRDAITAEIQARNRRLTSNPSGSAIFAERRRGTLQERVDPGPITGCHDNRIALSLPSIRKYDALFGEPFDPWTNGYLAALDQLDRADFDERNPRVAMYLGHRSVR